MNSIMGFNFSRVTIHVRLVANQTSENMIYSVTSQVRFLLKRHGRSGRDLQSYLVVLGLQPLHFLAHSRSSNLTILILYFINGLPLLCRVSLRDKRLSTSVCLARRLAFNCMNNRSSTANGKQDCLLAAKYHSADGAVVTTRRRTVNEPAATL